MPDVSVFISFPVVHYVVQNLEGCAVIRNPKGHKMSYKTKVMIKLSFLTIVGADHEVMGDWTLGDNHDGILYNFVINQNFLSV